MLSAFWRKSSSRTKRLITIGVFFLAALLMTSVGTLTPLSAAEANTISKELDELRGNISVQYVFGNNFMICLVMFVPIVGPIFGFWVLYNTGVVISAEVISSPVQGVSPLLLLFTLFVFPFTWMEFVSYSTGLAESVWLMRLALQGFGKREVKNAAVLVAIVAVILLLAAIVEVAMIIGLSP